MQSRNTRQFCLSRTFPWAILFVLGRVWLAGAAEPVTVEVAAGDYDRQDALVSVELPPAMQACQFFTLSRLDNGQTVPSQVDGRGENRRLVWIIRDKLPAGKSRQYRLAPANGPSPAADSVTVKDDGKRLLVHVAGKPVLAYNHVAVPSPDPKYAIHSRSGYLHPVYNPAGQVVTDDLNPHHAYHHGIWFAWRHTTFEGHATDGWYETTKSGKLEHVKTGALGGGPVFGHFTATMHQVDLTSPKGPKPILDETWRVLVYRFTDYFLFDLESTHTCAAGRPVTVDQCAYGGMSIRCHKDWFDLAKSKSDFLTSEGKVRKDGNHTRPRWCDIHGQVGGQMTGITGLDHPDNFRFPQPVRLCPTIPYFGFAPEVLGPFTIEVGKPYVSRYRFCVHNGEVDRALADRLWQDYAHPPVVTFHTGTETAAAKQN